MQPQVPAFADGGASPTGWTWECDQQLRLVALRGAKGMPPVPADWEGRSLSELFELQPDDDGRFAVLRALARQSGFDGQRVRADGAGGERIAMTLAGEALFDATGRFTGFRGVAAIAEGPESEEAPEPGPRARPAERGAPQSVAPQAPFVRGMKKVGRNEPCPCGSGKKFKHCHGQLAVNE